MKHIILISISLMALTGLLFSQTDIGNIVPDSAEPKVAFFQEEITLMVTDSTARVEGTYHFRNNTDRDFEMPVVFPFYVDSLCLFPHRMEAFSIQKGDRQQLPYKELRKHDGIRLRIPLKAGEESTWHLEYEQKIKSKRAVYIITSTAAWNKPLEQATYTFVAPESFEDISIWPEADTMYIENGLKHYNSLKYDFMPAKDMEISWK